MKNNLSFFITVHAIQDDTSFELSVALSFYNSAFILLSNIIYTGCIFENELNIYNFSTLMQNTSLEKVVELEILSGNADLLMNETINENKIVITSSISTPKI